MTPTAAKDDTSKSSPIGILIAIFVACAIMGGALAVGYRIRQSGNLMVRMAKEGPPIGDAWLQSLRRGDKAESLKPVSKTFRPGLTDERLAELKAQFERLGDKPAPGGWTISQGRVVFGIPIGLKVDDPAFTYKVILPPERPGARPEEVLIRMGTENDAIVVEGVEVAPQP